MMMPESFAVRGGGNGKPSVPQPRAIEKASASSLLSDEPRGFTRQARKNAPRPQTEHVCRKETSGFDPLWDGPRLVPSFVAQVLGQALPERHDRDAAALAAYAARAPRQPRLIDERG